jgi:hypothetical protein
VGDHGDSREANQALHVVRMEFLSLIIGQAGDAFPISHENAPSKWLCSQWCDKPRNPGRP